MGSTILSLRLPEADRQKMMTWALTATAACAVGAGMWWLARESYYSLVPPQYQYRPGMFTSWIATMLARHAKRRRSRRPIRVYMDGCFDLMHYGHANALRQAKALGDELVVGLVPDAEILRCKGPPIMQEAERLEMIESVKWVDEVITGVPYDLTPEFLHDLIHKHKIDYVIHGDDPCLLPDGTDAYAYAKKAGRFRMIKRTEGVSTTDIVGRMLMCSRDNARFAQDRVMLTREFSRGATGENEVHTGQDGFDKAFAQGEDGTVNIDGAADVPAMQKTPSKKTPTIKTYPGSVRVSRFMPTSRRIVQFSSGKSAPQGGKIVYIDGAFDLFHVGHVEILKAARAQGDFLLVGIHTDEEVQERRGPHLPIMGLHERALSVLACRYADEVIIGAPQIITDDLLTTFGIDLVVRGTVHEATDREAASEVERYKAPKARGILRTIFSPSDLTSASLIRRIMSKRAEFEEKQARKSQSEAAYYASAKQYVNEI